MLKSYVILSLRNILQHRGFALVNITGLAIAMAAALMIFNYATYEFGYDCFHVQRDRIFRVESKFYEGKTLTDDWPTASFGYAPAMKREMPGIKDYVRIAFNQPEWTVTYKENKFRESTFAFTEPSFFRMFSFQMEEGDTSALSAPNKVVISRSAASRYFGNEKPMGKILVFRTATNMLQCEVTGVLRDMPSNSHIHFDFMVSWSTLPRWINEFWYLHETYTYLLLEPGTDPATLEKAFPVMAEKYKTAEALKNKTWAITLNPLINIRLTPQKAYERESKGNRTLVWTLIFVGIIILCISWINFVNITIARSLERAREVGIRKVAGASRSQLIRQFIFESALMNGCALAGAILIIESTNPAFEKLTGLAIPSVLHASARFYTLSCLVMLIGILISAFYPALVLSAMKPITFLKGKFVHSRHAGKIRKSLVVIQFAASLILISATLVVYLQIRYMRSQPLGITTDRMLVVRFPTMSEHFQQKLVTFKNEITGLPDVQAITVSGNVPGTEAMAFYSNYRFDDPERQSRLYAMYAVDKNFTQTYELEIAAGRGFSEDFGTERNNLLLNEVSVKQLGFGNNAEAIGRQVKVESVDTPMIIVGVVKNFHQESLGKAYTPIMFFMQERIRWIPMRFISIKYRGNDIPAMRGKVKSAWDRFFPESTFDHFYLENFFDKQYGQDRKFGNIIAIFSAIAVILAALGLWALSLFTSVLRTKEMGIRKVLGASYSSLFTHLSAEFYYLIIISSLIATPISFWFLSRWLNNYPFHTNLKPWFLLVPVLLLFLICLVVTLRQTIKTVRLNPVDILIDE